MSDTKTVTAPTPGHRRGTTTAAAVTALEIVQDHECDEDGSIGGAMSVFWSKGHGHDPRAFIEAVVEYCLDNDLDIPRITGDDAPVETWQKNVARAEGVEYRRDPNPPTSPRSSRFPITVLDLERRSRGGVRCSVDDCDQPWRVGHRVRALFEPKDGDPTIGGRSMAVRMPLCREHSEKYPAPSYRVWMVPVGATITLPARDGAS